MGRKISRNKFAVAVSPDLTAVMGTEFPLLSNALIICDIIRLHCLVMAILTVPIAIVK